MLRKATARRDGAYTWQRSCPLKANELEVCDYPRSLELGWLHYKALHVDLRVQDLFLALLGLNLAFAWSFLL